MVRSGTLKFENGNGNPDSAKSEKQAGPNNPDPCTGLVATQT